MATHSREKYMDGIGSPTSNRSHLVANPLFFFFKKKPEGFRGATLVCSIDPESPKL